LISRSSGNPAGHHLDHQERHKVTYKVRTMQPAMKEWKTFTLVPFLAY